MDKKNKEVRLLPSDFAKKTKRKEIYNKLGNSNKQLIDPRGHGFFSFPEDIIGEQDIADRNFLVFYFDDEKDYNIVKKYFEILSTKTRSHPELNTKLLVKLIERLKNDK
jgi:hypothetical protein